MRIEEKIANALNMSTCIVDWNNIEVEPLPSYYQSVYRAYGDDNPMRRQEVYEKHMSVVRSEEYRQKMSEIKKGFVHSEETKDKMRQTALERGIGKWNLGVPKSEETKKRMSEAHMKKQRVPCSKCGKEYTKANIKKHEAACKGKE